MAVMRGALSANVTKLHQSYYLPSMAGIATMILENRLSHRPSRTRARTGAGSAHQLAGVEAARGHLPVHLERSVKSYRLNKFLHALMEPGHRARFLRGRGGGFARPA